MHIRFFFIIFFSLSFSRLCAEEPIFSSSLPTRRLLHQPFAPLDSSLPPSDPPSPPSKPDPKFPFSATSPPSPPAPTDSPFFPNVAAPPPPPSPANFASFPANISSLIVPHSETDKRGSNKLVALSIAAVVSALGVLAVAVFFYYYKRRISSRSEFSDDKTFRSGSSSRFFASVGGSGNAVVERPTVRSAQKLRTGPSSGGASSEFLYLGTLVDSRRIEEVSDSSRSQARKMESPEIHPLPPLLARRIGNVAVGAGNATDVTSTADEEDEFYSPRGSIGAGSGSRRAFAAVAERMKNSSSSPSPPSSPATSLDRSESIIYSPPLTFSSTRPEMKISPSLPPPAPPPPPPLQHHNATSSPEQIQSARSPSASSPIASSPERAVTAGSGKASPTPSSASSASEIVSAMNSLAASLHAQSRSPTVSTSSSIRESPEAAPKASAEQWLIASPGRDSNMNSDETSSISNDSVLSTLELDLSRRSLPQSPSPSPGRGTEESRNSPPQASVVEQESDQKRLSPSPSLSSSSSSSPARVHEAFTIKSPSLSSDSAHNNSPERELAENKDESPRMSDASEGILFELDPKKQSHSSSSPSHERDFHNNSDASTCSDDSDGSAESSPVRDPKPPSLAVPAPPPLPPPPTQFLRRQDSHSPRLATPPTLTPPSRPFVIQTPANLSISPIELPQPLLPVSASLETVEDTPKPKLKPLHWDKVRASSDREMVWDQLRTSSFKLNEEMIETLFVVKTPNSKPKETTPRSGVPWPNSENRVLDPKKSQNIAIALRALNVTIEEVCEALLEGNADALGNEVLESLLKMSPTKEEERKLMEYKDDSPVKLGPAERFLKAVLDVPFAFKRVEAMLYIANFDSEVDYLKKSFETLENGCEELRNSRMFMKLLEAVLKTGNRMNVGTNRGDAHAFKLDTLLKLADVKGADGKTTLLHFVVQEIIRSEGARFAGPAEDDAKLRRVGLDVVSALSSDLASVKKAAAMDSDVLSGDVAKLSRGIGAIREAVARVGEERFSLAVEAFARAAEGEILRIQAQESVALSLVKEITEYFHGNSAKEEAHPFRIFMVVRDFLSVLDRVCKEVGMINERTMVSSAHRFPVPMNPMLAQVLPAPKKPYSSSDEEDGS